MCKRLQQEECMHINFHLSFRSCPRITLSDILWADIGITWANIWLGWKQPLFGISLNHRSLLDLGSILPSVALVINIFGHHLWQFSWTLLRIHNWSMCVHRRRTSSQPRVLPCAEIFPERLYAQTSSRQNESHQSGGKIHQFKWCQSPDILKNIARHSQDSHKPHHSMHPSNHDVVLKGCCHSLHSISSDLCIRRCADQNDIEIYRKWKWTTINDRMGILSGGLHYPHSRHVSTLKGEQEITLHNTWRIENKWAR